MAWSLRKPLSVSGVVRVWTLSEMYLKVGCVLSFRVESLQYLNIKLL
ncbi:MAG: hypothetical protein ACKERG_02485 [Candidatus Hodgkinia cicadicola]